MSSEVTRPKHSYDTPPFTKEDALNHETPQSHSGAPLIPGEYIPTTESGKWLEHSLRQDKADRIFHHLWFAGTPKKFESLSKHRVMGRKVMPSENPHLHLVWVNEVLYIKPLPPCLTNFEFFRDFICGDLRRYTLACGLLFSYCHLVCAESDFRIAIEYGLLRSKDPQDLTWEKWQYFRVAISTYLEAHTTMIAKRYHRYGALRLARLNIIYFFRFCRPAGYHNRFSQYLPFFSRYFGAAILLFAFASVTLNAMQVALQQTTVPMPVVFAMTCYRFSVVILVAVVAIIFTLITVFIPIVVHDLSTGLVANKREARTFRKIRSASIVSEIELGEIRT